MNRTVLAVTALVALGACSAPASASTAATAAKGDCPARKGTLAKNSIGRIWHRRGSIYGCTTVYGEPANRRRLGPYTTGAKVAFDGANVAFTVSRVRDGKRVDRVFAANVDDGRRWLVGRKAVPAAAAEPEHEARIQKLSLRDQSVAWITRTGDVVMAMREPASEPTPIGAPPGPLTVVRNLLLVGRFPGTGATALARSMRYKELPGEGDECGGGNPYTLTVRPDASGRPVGVEWHGHWTSTSDVCT